MQRLQQTVIGILGLLLIIVIYKSVVPRAYVPEPEEPVIEVACIGQPIRIDQPYVGTVVDPWTCQIQCNDDQPRYILYSNGKATQCETPPGCNDFGEDRGVTCVPLGASS